MPRDFEEWLKQADYDLDTADFSICIYWEIQKQIPFPIKAFEEKNN